MKTCLWLILILGVMVAGCAPGYYETGPAYQEEEPTQHLISTSFNNPETPEEKSERIWRESMGR